MDDDSLCIIFTCSREGKRKKDHRYDTMRTSDEFPKREKEKVPTYREEGEWKKKRGKEE